MVLLLRIICSWYDYIVVYVREVWFSGRESSVAGMIILWFMLERCGSLVENHL